jgi:hypothetical protein
LPLGVLTLPRTLGLSIFAGTAGYPGLIVLGPDDLCFEIDDDDEWE